MVESSSVGEERLCRCIDGLVMELDWLYNVIRLDLNISESEEGIGLTMRPELVDEI